MGTLVPGEDARARSRSIHKNGRPVVRLDSSDDENGCVSTRGRVVLWL